MLTVKSFETSSSDFYKAALKIRHEVFIEEQNVDPALEIENEDSCKHYLLLQNEEPIGVARWRKTEKGIKLERFAILAAYRNKGYGTVILENVLQDILPLAHKIYLHSQLKAVNYYQRQGFVKTGEIFQEAGIDHYLMVLEPGKV
jgi:predicted GNAT family N-acyltransferase